MSGDTTDLASVRARLRGVTATTAGDGTPTAVCLYIILCCSKGRHMLYLTYYLLSDHSSLFLRIEVVSADSETKCFEDHHLLCK